MRIPANPTASILYRPGAAWTVLRAADPSWTAALVRHLLPLALLPALAWPVGQAAAGVLSAQPAPLVAAFMATFAFTVASVVLLALGLYVLAPFFRCRRDWNRSFVVAAYASTPVLASGALLVIPMLLIVGFAAFAFFLVLCDMGVKQLLGCREESAAAYVVGGCLSAVFGSMALGALCSAAGLI